jgi:hypothetical protein
VAAGQDLLQLAFDVAAHEPAEIAKMSKMNLQKCQMSKNVKNEPAKMNLQK